MHLRAIGIYSCAMTNCFDILLHPDDMRWAAAEGVSETVIAAVLLLHERSVKEIAAELSAAELEQVIRGDREAATHSLRTDFKNFSNASRPFFPVCLRFRRFPPGHVVKYKLPSRPGTMRPRQR